MSSHVDPGPPGPTYSFYKAVVAILVFAVLALVGIWTGSRDKGGGGALYHEVRLLMDTGVEIMIPADGPAEAGDIGNRVFDLMEELEGRFSRNLAGSELSAVNDGAGSGPVEVSLDTIKLLEQAWHYSELSGGAFDPTVAPLLDRWGFLEGDYRIPAAEEIERLLPLVDYTRVIIDSPRSRVSFLGEGVYLDLGGIAKGYIVDRGVEQLRRSGVSYGLVDAGGDIGIIGPKPGGEPWRIGIRHPRKDDKNLAVVPLRERLPPPATMNGPFSGGDGAITISLIPIPATRRSG